LQKYIFSLEKKKNQKPDPEVLKKLITKELKVLGTESTKNDSEMQGSFIQVNAKSATPELLVSTST